MNPTSKLAAGVSNVITLRRKLLQQQQQQYPITAAAVLNQTSVNTSPYLGGGGAVGSSHPAFGIVLIVLLIIFFFMFLFSVFLRRSACALGALGSDSTNPQSNSVRHPHAAPHTRAAVAGGLDRETIAKLPIVLYNRASGGWRWNYCDGSSNDTDDHTAMKYSHSSVNKPKLLPDEAVVIKESEHPKLQIQITAPPMTRQGAELPLAEGGNGLRSHIVDVVNCYEEAAISGAAAECVVCLADFEDGEVLRMLPRCQHCFHPQCIDMWLFSHSTCPLCRRSLLPLIIPSHALQDHKLLLLQQPRDSTSSSSSSTPTPTTSSSTSSSP